MKLMCVRENPWYKNVDDCNEIAKGIIMTLKY